LGSMRTSAVWAAGDGDAKAVLKSRAGRLTSTTALQSVTRTTRQGWPFCLMMSPGRRTEAGAIHGRVVVLVVVLVVGAKRDGWAASAVAPGLVKLGAFAGDALTVRPVSAKRLKYRAQNRIRVAGWDRARGASHGVMCWGVRRRGRRAYFRGVRRARPPVRMARKGCCQSWRLLFSGSQAKARVRGWKGGMLAN